MNYGCFWRLGALSEDVYDYSSPIHNFGQCVPICILFWNVLIPRENKHLDVQTVNMTRIFCLKLSKIFQTKISVLVYGTAVRHRLWRWITVYEIGKDEEYYVEMDVSCNIERCNRRQSRWTKFYRYVSCDLWGWMR